MQIMESLSQQKIMAALEELSSRLGACRALARQAPKKVLQVFTNECLSVISD